MALRDLMTPIILLTRPEAANMRFATQLREAPGFSAKIVESPLLEIISLSPSWRGAVPRGIILTSENGAVAAAALTLPRGLTAFCVGDQTARIAIEAGFAAVSANGNADTLIGLILSRREKGPLVHLRGEHARGDISRRLDAAGVSCSELIVYRQEERQLGSLAVAALSGDAPVIVPLFSPRSAALFAAQGPFLAQVHVIAISDAAARGIDGLAVASLTVAATPDGQAMLSAVRRRIAALGGAPSA